MVTMLPMPIMTLITSAALTDIFCASSETVMVSGIDTFRTIGAVGISNACSFCVFTKADRFRLPPVFFLRRPDLSAEICNSRFEPCSFLPRLLRLPFLSSLLGAFVVASATLAGRVSEFTLGPFVDEPALDKSAVGDSTAPPTTLPST